MSLLIPLFVTVLNNYLFVFHRSFLSTKTNFDCNSITNVESLHKFETKVYDDYHESVNKIKAKHSNDLTTIGCISKMQSYSSAMEKYTKKREKFQFEYDIDDYNPTPNIYAAHCEHLKTMTTQTLQQCDEDSKQFVLSVKSTILFSLEHKILCFNYLFVIHAGGRTTRHI